ncbi:MAG: general secretion pathway protein [Arcicella sp.]|nr:general secretion pathway protein [Arcicella sp.]
MALAALSNILLGNQYIGIEHYTLDANDCIALLLIEKKKGELIISAKENTSNTENIPKHCDKRLPFYLVINTNQVIQKELEGVDGSNEKLIRKAFPNLAWDDFYYEIWRLKTKSIVAVSRKTYVDGILAQYQGQGVLIAGLSLGVCSISEIISYSEKSELETNTQVVSWDEINSVVVGKKTTALKTYSLNGLAVENSYLLGFAGILRLILGSSITNGNVLDYNAVLRGAFDQKTLFIKGIKVMIGSLLTLLLINFFAFNYYYRKTEEVSSELSMNQSSLEDINATKARIAVKETKVKEFIDLSSSKSSQIINEIASKVPNSILLTEFAFQPLEKKIKEEEPIKVLEKTLLVSGATIDNAAFTNWVEAIEKIKRVQQVTIVNFGKDETNATGFTIKILLQ